TFIVVQLNVSIVWSQRHYPSGFRPINISSVYSIDNRNLIGLIVKPNILFSLEWQALSSSDERFVMSFPNKSDRVKCWESRDDFWKCLDDNPENPDLCAKFRQTYMSMCPSQWVKHFDRKREYLKFKDRIQNEGTRHILGDNLTVVGGEQGRSKVELQGIEEEATRKANTSTTARIFRKFQPPTYR
ncbi:unnamed protein product, partial [Allacma fusca]